MDSASTVDTSPPTNNVSANVYVCPRLSLPPALFPHPSRDLPLSTFFVSRLSRPLSDLTASLLRSLVRSRPLALVSRAKDVCFVNQQSWLKLPPELSQSSRPGRLPPWRDIEDRW